MSIHDQPRGTPPARLPMASVPDPVGVIGKIVGGRYDVLRLVGEGGSGAVYEARHRLLDERRALKFIRADRSTPEAFARFRREARIGANDRIPQIARVYDLDVHTDGEGCPWYFISMSFLDGESLGQRLRRCGRLSWHEAVALILKAAIPLEAAHTEGIIHRDIKPDNLLVTSEGELYVLRVLDCVDYDRSTYDRCRDGRPGDIKKFIFKPGSTDGHHIFKILTYEMMPPFVSEDFKRLVDDAGLLGFWFHAVEPDGSLREIPLRLPPGSRARSRRSRPQQT